MLPLHLEVKACVDLIFEPGVAVQEWIDRITIEHCYFRSEVELHGESLGEVADLYGDDERRFIEIAAGDRIAFPFEGDPM